MFNIHNHKLTLSGLLEEKARQTEKVKELEKTLTVQEGNYLLLQENYDFLKDSLETAKKVQVLHQQAIDKKTAELTDEIERRFLR